MKYNQELVKKVQEGTLAIHNINCTKEELQELIKYIFPKDLSVKGDCLYYYHNKLECKGWFPTNLELNIPYKSVKDFVEEEFVLPDLYAVKCENEEERKEVWLHNFPSNKYYVKHSDYIIGGKDISKYGVIFLYWRSIKSAKIWFKKEDLPVFTFNEWKKLKETNMKEGEIIGYKLIKPEFRKAVNFMLDRIGNVLAQDGITKDYTTQHLLKDAGVLDIWFEKIYTPEKPVEVMVDMGSFKLKVIKDGIFHKTEDITNFVQNLHDVYTKLPSKFGSYDCIVDEITFKKTGCENNKTSLKQWVTAYTEYLKLKN